VIQVERSDFVALPSQDYERTRRFYGETLGLPASPKANERYPEYETGNISIGFYTMREGREFNPSNGVVALRVPDVAEARAALEAAGIEFDGETLDTGVCHMASFTDPDGNALMLHRRYAP
jgi:predicted enzyme related to lactoylglutathione lyase